MSGNFCPGCGAPRKQGVRFCGGCGATLGDGTPSVAVPSAAPPANQPVNAAGWHVAVGDQLPAFAPVAPPAGSPAQPQAQAQAARAPGPSMRGASMGLLFASGTDLAAAYATNEPTAMKMATVRAGLTALTVLAGLVAGRSRGFFSRIAMLSSLVLAAVQSTSLYSFGRSILVNPQLLNGLLPNVATQGFAFLAALRTALAARK